MQFSARSRFAPVALLAAVVGCSACSPIADEPTDTTPPPPQVPFLAGAGVAQNQSLAAILSAGWSVCLDEPYGTEATPLATTLAACSGKYMMLACKIGTGDAVALAAADLRTVVTQVDAATNAAHHVANGVGWYFSDDLSWGFFPAGQGVNRAPCDWDADGTQTVKEQRLCWHTSAGDMTGGYRCGATINLNGSATWRRLVLVHP